ncbi:MAG TPA: polysaccharide deacetylase family protein [Tissierellaceae bacterium]|nr:polysaccharide deacetylase family protein [Tissierellaceae bacterium]
MKRSRKSRRERYREKQRKKRRRFSIFLLILGLLVTRGIFKGVDLLKKDVAEATKVDETLSMIGNDNPLNIVLETKKEEVEEEKAEEVLEEKRKEIEEKRLAQQREKHEKLQQDRLEGNTNNGEKVAYLTFDDGPSKKVTPMILDILNEYDAKATFFVVGKMVEENPEILKRAFEEGHAIANHSYSHDYGYLYGSAENFIKDFNKADKVIKDVLGESFTSKVIRFPGGSFGEHKAVMKDAAVDAGFDYVDWNALNGDAEGLNKTKEELISRIKETTQNKNSVIILMHDTDAKKSTALSLREVLDYLIDEGYRFDVLY